MIFFDPSDGPLHQDPKSGDTLGFFGVLSAEPGASFKWGDYEGGPNFRKHFVNDKAFVSHASPG